MNPRFDAAFFDDLNAILGPPSYQGNALALQALAAAAGRLRGMSAREVLARYAEHLVFLWSSVRRGRISSFPFDFDAQVGRLEAMSTADLVDLVLLTWAGLAPAAPALTRVEDDAAARETSPTTAAGAATGMDSREPSLDAASGPIDGLAASTRGKVH